MISVVMLTASVAMLSDRYVLNKIRDSHVNVMIVTFAMALLIQSIIQILYYPKDGIELIQFGSHDYTLPAVVSISKIVGIYGARIFEVKIVAFFFVIVAVILLYLFIWKTRMGVALRAVAQDEEASSLTGIDIRKTTAVVSGIGMGLIAFASVLTSPFAVVLWNPFMGWGILIMAIAVVTLGGLGSLPGSIIAAFIIGYAETIVSSIPDISQFSVALPLIVVFIVMIIKPEGLLGEKKELEA
jgi:branched-chain amino acid transport system permease protein